MLRARLESCSGPHHLYANREGTIIVQLCTREGTIIPANVSWAGLGPEEAAEPGVCQELRSILVPTCWVNWFMYRCSVSWSPLDSHNSINTPKSWYFSASDAAYVRSPKWTDKQNTHRTVVRRWNSWMRVFACVMDVQRCIARDQCQSLRYKDLMLWKSNKCDVVSTHLWKAGQFVVPWCTLKRPAPQAFALARS